MAEETFTFTGNDATNYEKYLGPLLFEPSAIMLLPFLDAPNIHFVLEISSGTGRVTKHLRNLFPESISIIASDISSDMLEVAKEKLTGDDVKFQVADAQDLPFADSSFDLVVCQYGIMFFPDKLRGFREALRVLKPGGRFVFTTWDRTENMPLMKIIFNDSIISLFPGEDPKRFLTPFLLHDPAVLNGFLTQAGFRSNQVFPVDFKSTTSSPEDVINGLFLKHPLGREVAAKNPDLLKPVAEKMLEKVRNYLNEVSYTFDLRAYIGIGNK